MSIELQGIAFVKAGSVHYRPGRKAWFRLTINPGTTEAAAADAAKGGSVTVATPVTGLVVTFLDDEASYTPGALSSVNVTYGYVQTHYVGTGDRNISAIVPAQGSDFDAVLVTAFQTFGTVWQAEVETVPPAGTNVPGTGLLGRYFGNPDLTGTPVYEAVEVPRFEDTEGPHPGVPRLFSARWTGRLVVRTAGQHRFKVRADDGFRLYLDGRLVMDFWSDQNETERLTGFYTYAIGQEVTVWLEYFNGSRRGTIEFSWQEPGEQFAQVPAAVLYSTDGTEALPPALAPPEQLRFFAEPVSRY